MIAATCTGSRVPVCVVTGGGYPGLVTDSASHRRPPGTDDATVRAVGELTEALETVERARGHLYAFHQLTGHAHLVLGQAVEELHDAGHVDLAAAVSDALLGRDVLPGRWTFQVVEEYDSGYYRVFGEWERRVRDELMDGRRHVAEAEMKQRGRTE